MIHEGAILKPFKILGLGCQIYRTHLKNVFWPPAFGGIGAWL
jgi:hypothetical protein